MSSIQMDSKKFNQRLAAGIFLLSAIIGLRLFQSALDTDNMNGFYYSSLHVVLVAVGSFFALRRKYN